MPSVAPCTSYACCFARTADGLPIPYGDRFHSTRPKRPLESVILGGTKKERLLRDVKQFLAKGDEYLSLGVRVARLNE